ncbi:MAG: urea ABC transporter ATP-binding subunit UrtE [Deltaproteobacteria bacterium]|jgi:urea transport system ATP-binding protein|nr:urea ABC transporter ATP-binding subunit UrtE [Deltaproteobacteria bacterium]
MLTVAGLNQYYGQSHILRETELTVTGGRCSCLMGRNGAGKTTFLKCLMGLLPVKSGKIIFDGRDITDLKPEARARLGLGYVPQGRQIFPALTVLENLLLALAARRGGGREIPPLVFELFPVLKDMLPRRGGDLSGGQQQQLAMARALVLNPRLLILDEPTEGIQPNVVEDIIKVVRRLTSEGLSVLEVEQKVPAARKTGDRFFIMERGRIMAQGEMADLSESTARSLLSV